MRGVDDEDPIEEFAAYAADPAFHDRVHTGCLSSGAYDPDAYGAEHLIEQCGELAVPITNQELECPGPLPQVHQQVSGLLGDPAGGRIRGDAQDVYPARNKHNDHKTKQTNEHDRLGVEEVTGEDPFGLGAQELSPS